MHTIKSPTRFDLAGGTLDLWPLWAILGRATTVNVSIDIFTHCHLEPQAGKKIRIESLDLKKTWDFNSLQDLLNSSDEALGFYKAHLMHWQPQDGFYMKTQSESPVGGGLGGSSSLSVSVYKAFLAWRGEKRDIHDIVRHCSNIEAFILKTPTGTQDYYGAAASGLNIIDFDSSGSKLTTLQIHKEEFTRRFLVVYTGKSHHSGINNWQVLKKFIDGDPHTEKALRKIQEAGARMKKICLAGQWQDIPSVFDLEFEARTMLADSFMSEEISKLKKISDKAGAEGFKICGAGGGGCVVVWTSPEKRESVKAAVTAGGFQVLAAQPV
jgi:D-glycero-alpha-D-manno-heptose-7-phosphate kinase